jgi:hypothetical protein
MHFHSAASRFDWAAATRHLRTYLRAASPLDAAVLGGSRWVRRVADEVVAAMLDRCDADYERLHVLDELADVDVRILLLAPLSLLIIFSRFFFN